MKSCRREACCGDALERLLRGPGRRVLALVAATFAGIPTPTFQPAMKLFGWGPLMGSRGDVSAAAASARRNLRATAAGNQQ